jgi:hypothetical protein
MHLQGKFVRRKNSTSISITCVPEAVAAMDKNLPTYIDRKKIVCLIGQMTLLARTC